MHNDVDAFLASLEEFSSPSLENSINQVINVGDRAHSVRNPTQTDQIPPEGGSRIRRGNKKEDKRPREADTTRTESSSNTWCCPMCTFENNIEVTLCTACGNSSPSQVNESSERSCPRCTFNNPSHSRRCTMCSFRLPPNNKRPRATEAMPTSEISSSNPNTSPSSPQLHSPVSSSQLARSALRTSAAIPPSNPENEHDSDTDLSDISSSSDSTDADDEGGNNVCDNEELVRFLQTLDCVPFENLPTAAVPATMPNAALKSFQLQALHWLVQREKGASSDSSLDGSLESSPASSPSHESIYRYVSSTTLESKFRWNQPNGTSSPSEREASADSITVRGGIMADYMGLGKTRTMIALCEATRGPRYDRVKGSLVESPSTLIACPTSLISHWSREIRQCVTVPSLRILIYHGSRRKRLSIFELAQNYDYVLTTYQTLRYESFENTSQPSKMSMIRWRRVILDEAHYIRNLKTQQFKACMQLEGDCKWVVTATPIQNSINDLFPLLKFLRVPHFGVSEWWNREIIHYLNESLTHPRPTTALRLLFGSLMLRRLPDSMINGQKLLSLPPKTVKTMMITLSREEFDFYEGIRRRASDKFASLAKGNTKAISTYSTAFEMLIRCRQACLHPYIVICARNKHVLGNDQENPTLLIAPEKAKNDMPDDKEMEKFTDHLSRSIRTAVEDGLDASFVKDLLDEIRHRQLRLRECNICLDNLLYPAILPCAHVFCEECIRHALQQSHRCPLCKRFTRTKEILLVPDSIGAPQVPSDGSNITAAQLSDMSLWTVSSKTQYLIDSIKKIPANEKVVVFSFFVTYLKYAKKCLEKENISAELFTGELTMKQKQSALETFGLLHKDEDDDASETPSTRGHNNDCKTSKPGVRVLLASVTTCGVGLNLTCASHCFLMDPIWNPGVEEQALNRIYRIGQNRPVTMTKILAKDTIEEKIEALNNKKKILSSYCVSLGSSSSGIAPSMGMRGTSSRMSKDELLALFKNDSDEEQETSSFSSDSTSLSSSD